MRPGGIDSKRQGMDRSRAVLDFRIFSPRFDLTQRNLTLPTIADCTAFFRMPIAVVTAPSLRPCSRLSERQPLRERPRRHREICDGRKFRRNRPRQRRHSNPTTLKVQVLVSYILVNAGGWLFSLGIQHKTRDMPSSPFARCAVLGCDPFHVAKVSHLCPGFE